MVLGLRDKKAVLLANSHIDVAWLWLEEEIKRVCKETFENALSLIERYGITYAQSNMIFYEWMEKEQPDLFMRILRAIRMGKWEVVGGSWVEFDANMPMGESLIRQFVIGKKYAHEKLGVDVQICWLPDTFGFPITLPKILRTVGIRYFLTAKLSWNDETEFPYNIFIWRGDDGSEVLAYLTPSSYDTYLCRRNVINVLRTQLKKQKIPCILFLYGRGDHGGGPTEDEAREASILTKNAWMKIGKATDFFKEVEREYSRNLPLWDDELYLEFHRGVFTTQLRLKNLIRRSEAELLNLEALIAFLRMLGEKVDLREELEYLWKEVLMRHFHDTFAGTLSANVAMENIRNLITVLAQIKRIKEKILARLVKALSREEKDVENILILNTLPWKRTIIVRDEKSGRPVVIRDVPGFGYKIVKPNQKSAVGTLRLYQRGRLIIAESKKYILFVDKKSGLIAQIYDKKLEQKILARPMELRIYRDDPNLFRKSITGVPAGIFDAWEIFIYDRKKPVYEHPRLVGIEIVENNSARIVIRAKLKYTMFPRGTLLINLNYTLSDEDKIQIELNIKSRCGHKLVKLVIPIIHAGDYAIYGAPYGYIKRRDFSSPNATRHEKAKYEVPSVGWVLVPTTWGSVAVATDNRFGFSKDGEELQISILKTPTYPAEAYYRIFMVLPEWARSPALAESAINKIFFALNNAIWKLLIRRYIDQGSLSCRIAIVSNKEQKPIYGLRLWRELITPININYVASEPETYQVISINDDEVFGHLKPADTDMNVILRLVNYSEEPKDIRVQGANIRKIWEIDVFENKRREIDAINSEFRISLKRNEIKTYKLVRLSTRRE